MSYYHIKNINIDKAKNRISADLADSSISPLNWFHANNLSDEETFKEKYADFIYNLVSGNFHPTSNNRYSKLVMNPYLSNYYDDAKDLGTLKTYEKYKDVIMGIMSNDYDRCFKLQSDRELNPDKYYKLRPIMVNDKSNYYTNGNDELFCVNEGKLNVCSLSEKNYGYPLYEPLDIENFIDNNEFLNDLNKKENTNVKEFEPIYEGTIPYIR